MPTTNPTTKERGKRRHKMLPFRSLGAVLASVLVIIICAFGIIAGKQSDHVFAYMSLAIVAYVFLIICCCCVLPVWNSEMDCNKVTLLFKRTSSDGEDGLDTEEKPKDIYEAIDDSEAPTKKLRSCGICEESAEKRRSIIENGQPTFVPVDVKRNRAPSLKSSALSNMSETTSLSFASEPNLPIPDTIFLTHPNGSFTRYVKLDPNLLGKDASYV